MSDDSQKPTHLFGKPIEPADPDTSEGGAIQKVNKDQWFQVNRRASVTQEEADMVREFMLNIVRQIALLDVEQMEMVQQAANESHTYWDSIGGMIYPTIYRALLQRGGLEHSRLQSEVVDHLIAIRKLATRMDDIVRKNQGDEANA